MAMKTGIKCHQTIAKVDVLDSGWKDCYPQIISYIHFHRMLGISNIKILYQGYILIERIDYSKFNFKFPSKTAKGKFEHFRRKFARE
jgi:hypothetical protein